MKIMEMQTAGILLITALIGIAGIVAINMLFAADTGHDSADIPVEIVQKQGWEMLVKNSGAETIKTGSLKFYADGKAVYGTNVKDINPGEVATVIISGGRNPSTISVTYHGATKDFDMQAIGPSKENGQDPSVTDGEAVFSDEREYNTFVSAANKQSVCGNGIRETGESCDGKDMGIARSCENLGFSGGGLSCDSYCQLDISGCRAGASPVTGQPATTTTASLITTTTIIPVPATTTTATVPAINTTTAIPSPTTTTSTTTTPPGATCTPGYVCSGTGLYYRNADCSMSLRNTCLFGCNSATIACNSAPDSTTTTTTTVRATTTSSTTTTTAAPGTTTTSIVASAPSCWKCTESYYSAWISDGYCDPLCGETDMSSSACYTLACVPAPATTTTSTTTSSTTTTVPISATTTTTVKPPATTTTTTLPDNKPSVSITASPNPAKTGQAITITVSGTDDNDISRVDALFGESWQTQECGGIQTACVKTWTTTESSAGTRTYWAGATDSKGQGANMASASITVTQSLVPRQIPILELKYFPLSGGGLDPAITGMTDSLTSIRSKVSASSASALFLLKEGTKYHGYKDPSADPYLDYYAYDSKEFLKAMPVSSNRIKTGPDVYRPDYMKMLTQDADVCNYVDNLGVKEVWIWGYHYGNIEPVESDMSMGTSISAYWNHGTYGDVSNSEQSDDLPKCRNTYVMYNYNYQRDYLTAVHDHFHQMENLMGYADDSLFWYSFVGKHYSEEAGSWACGNAHFPPNTNIEYRYSHGDYITTKCEDWHPDGSGQSKTFTCSEWGCTEAGFYTWWFQSIPGYDNGLYYNGKQLRNWWDFKADFDGEIKKGKNLVIG